MLTELNAVPLFYRLRFWKTVEREDAALLADAERLHSRLILAYALSFCGVVFADSAEDIVRQVLAGD